LGRGGNINGDRDLEPGRKLAAIRRVKVGCYNSDVRHV